MLKEQTTRRHFKRFTQIRLLIRCVILIAACYFYVTQREAFMHLAGGDLLRSGDRAAGGNSGSSAEMLYFFKAVWLIFFVGMAARYFPSGIDSMGCQKQFERFFMPSEWWKNREKTEPDEQKKAARVDMAKRWSSEKRKADTGALGTLLLWSVWNGILYILYFMGILNDGHMLLLCLAYAVCDMVCILYICPFRVLIMKNRCCTTCRIYNWDALMMMTPMLASRNSAVQLLNIMALGLFLRWERDWSRHPERFLEMSNEALQCGRCEHPASCAGCVRKKK